MYEYTLPVGLLITGNMRGELAGFRTNNGNQISLALAIHIRNGATHKATLISYFPVATNFFGFTPGHVAAFPSTAITDTGYITVAGDVLYAELGLGWIAQVADSAITTGYNNANADWGAGDNGIADTNPTILNPWVEFETTLGPAPSIDDPLATFSATSVTARPFSPSKPGLQFFARDTNIESIWNGTAWKEMVSSLNANGGTAIGGNVTFNNTSDINVTLTGSTFTWNAQALSTQANRNKRVTLTDDVSYGALLSANSSFAIAQIGLLAPTATIPFLVSSAGTIGRSIVSDATMMSFSNYTYSGASRLTGWGLNSFTSTGSGGVTIMQIGGTYAPAGASAVESVLIDSSIGNANALATGNLTGARITLTTTGAATRTLYRVFDARVGSALGSTLTTVEYYGIGQTPGLGTVPTHIGYRQGAAFTVGTLRRAGSFFNSVEIAGTPGRFIVNNFDRGFMYKDNQGTAHYWELKGLADGTPQILDIGTTLPTT